MQRVAIEAREHPSTEVLKIVEQIVQLLEPPHLLGRDRRMTIDDAPLRRRAGSLPVAVLQEPPNLVELSES
jgi:hypothetical protein